jgi:hypothetical protein
MKTVVAPDSHSLILMCKRPTNPCTLGSAEAGDACFSSRGLQGGEVFALITGAIGDSVRRHFTRASAG